MDTCNRPGYQIRGYTWNGLGRRSKKQKFPRPDLDPPVNLETETLKDFFCPVLDANLISDHISGLFTGREPDEYGSEQNKMNQARDTQQQLRYARHKKV